MRTARCRRTINFTASTAGRIVLCSAWDTPRGVRFGELTVTPAAALDNKRLPETDLRFGRMMEETL